MDHTRNSSKTSEICSEVTERRPAREFFWTEVRENVCSVSLEVEVVVAFIVRCGSANSRNWSVAVRAA